MATITITTDLGYRDPYLAMVKGLLYQQNSNLNIVDVSCNVSKHAHNEAAFALKNSMPYFKNGTIHLFAVKNLNSSTTITDLNIDNSRYLITSYKNQYIICPDNGVLTLIDKEFNEPVYQLYFENQKQHSFYLRDIFVDAATKLNNNIAIKEFAHQTTDYCKLLEFECTTTPTSIQGNVIYEDDFGNLITNITKNSFDTHIGNKRFGISFPGGDITKISNSYDEVKIGDVVCFFNAMNLLEIAALGQSATKIVLNRNVLARYKLDKINIEIYD